MLISGYEVAPCSRTLQSEAEFGVLYPHPHDQDVVHLFLSPLPIIERLDQQGFPAFGVRA